MNPATRSPAALAYFNEIGVDYASAVKAVVATHWHDDHIQGLVEVVKACPEATVVCSLALRHDEIFAFVMDQEGAGGAFGSGVDELRELLRHCASSNRQIVWAKENLPIVPRPPGSNPDVIALSPSEDACERSLVEIIEKATKRRSRIRRRFRVPEGPNGSSVALWAKRSGSGVLLGADLETSQNPRAGWDAVLTTARPHAKSSGLKVPHHGSKNAHHDSVWTDLLETDALAVITPWIRGLKVLPTPQDVTRLRSLTSKLFVTADPKTVLKRRKDKDLQKRHKKELVVVAGWGHVRARQVHGAKSWVVNLAGDAIQIA